jgi:hypothetical protein
MTTPCETDTFWLNSVLLQFSVLLQVPVFALPIGFGDQPGAMVDSDAVIGQSGNMEATAYRIIAYSFYGIAPVPVRALLSKHPLGSYRMLGSYC